MVIVKFSKDTFTWKTRDGSGGYFSCSPFPDPGGVRKAHFEPFRSRRATNKLSKGPIRFGVDKVALCA